MTSTGSDLSRQSGFAPVEAGQLYYETAGRGEPLVLIHGNVGDCRHWDGQLDAFGSRRRVIRYDVRGFGKSSLPVEGSPYSDYEDLAALLDWLGVDSAHLAGWSMGCGIAIDFVLAYPERARSLIAIGPWVSGYTSPAAKEAFDEFAGIAAALATAGQSAAVEAFMNLRALSGTIVVPAAGTEFRRIAADYSFWPFAHRSPVQSLQPAAVTRIGDITVPTLILTAERDMLLCAEVADLLHSSIRHSRKVVLRNAGHFLHLEMPNEFNAHVLEFLATGA